MRSKLSGCLTKGLAVIGALFIALILLVLILGDGEQEEGVSVTGTPAPSKIPVPSKTPAPTPTLEPPVPGCEAILSQKGGKTQAQWMDYLRQMDGRRLEYWAGFIDSVDEAWLTSGYDVRVEADGGCDISFRLTDKEEALSLEKDQRVTISGWIEGFDTLFGLTVELKDNPEIIR